MKLKNLTKIINLTQQMMLFCWSSLASWNKKCATCKDKFLSMLDLYVSMLDLLCKGLISYHLSVLKLYCCWGGGGGMGKKSVKKGEKKGKKLYCFKVHINIIWVSL